MRKKDANWQAKGPLTLGACVLQKDWTKYRTTAILLLMVIEESPGQKQINRQRE